MSKWNSNVPTYDPSITQRVWKEIQDATDKHMVSDLLLKLIKEQEKRVDSLTQEVVDLKREAMTGPETSKMIASRYAGLIKEMHSLKRVFKIALVPVAMACLLGIIKLIFELRGW